MSDRDLDQQPAVPPRPDTDPGAVAEGDAQLDMDPPNVTETQPAPEPREDAAGARAGDGDRTRDLEKELAAAGDRHLRLVAEFDNYRKRVERERMESWGRAQAELAGRLLDSLDDLERVWQHAPGADADALLQGVQLVERKLRQALQAAGLEEVEADNARFDPNAMEAVAMVETDSPAEDDIVSDVFQRGYRFRGTLLRPARVRVKKHGA